MKLFKELLTIFIISFVKTFFFAYGLIQFTIKYIIDPLFS